MEKITIENAIYMWFNMKYEIYNKLYHDDSIYLYDEGQEYADIRIHKKFKYIYYNWDFRNEFFGVFSVEIINLEYVMTKWVEDTFGLKGFTPQVRAGLRVDLLKIPK